jgi:hypothetical protein
MAEGAPVNIIVRPDCPLPSAFPSAICPLPSAFPTPEDLAILRKSSLPRTNAPAFVYGAYCPLPTASRPPGGLSPDCLRSPFRLILLPLPRR